jgi:hypothetical protein
VLSTVQKINIKTFRRIKMKKIVSLLAMAVMVVSLTGCLDDPDGSKEKVSSSISGLQL